MSESVKETGGAGPSHRGAEIAVAGIIAVLAVIGIYGSLKVGIGWASDGPGAGFFPFYVSLVVLLSSAINIAHAVLRPADGKVFVEWSQLRQVLSVLIPTIIYVAAIPYTGMYVASIILITSFMRWLGRYNWATSIAVGIGMPVFTFFMFEIWFLVPLPKGPLEHLLGY
jgi:putative tricarboxylic transport membrane protein